MAKIEVKGSDLKNIVRRFMLESVNEIFGDDKNAEINQSWDELELDNQKFFRPYGNDKGTYSPTDSNSMPDSNLNVYNDNGYLSMMAQDDDETGYGKLGKAARETPRSYMDAEKNAFGSYKMKESQIRESVLSVVSEMKRIMESRKKKVNEALSPEMEDELSYDMREFTKAMQKSNGTYHAKSSDGTFQTGDNVVVHSRLKGDIKGVITDFDVNFMTFEETADVDYQDENGKTFTLMSVPLSKIQKIDGGTTIESKVDRSLRRVFAEAITEMMSEEWYPEDDDDISDYSYGSIMTLEPSNSFELSDETVAALQNINEEYIETQDKYVSVLVRKVTVTPDDFGEYDLRIEAAVSAPDMPLREIESQTQEMVWLWIEEKTGTRTTNIAITDEKTVFDRRQKNQ